MSPIVHVLSLPSRSDCRRIPLLQALVAAFGSDPKLVFTSSREVTHEIAAVTHGTKTVRTINAGIVHSMSFRIRLLATFYFAVVFEMHCTKNAEAYKGRLGFYSHKALHSP